MKFGFLILLVFFRSSIGLADEGICEPFLSLFHPKAEIYTPNMSDIHSISQTMLAGGPTQSVDETADKLSGIVGRCVLDSPSKISPALLDGPINYDSLVLPYMTGRKTFKVSAPETKAEDPLFLQARDLKVPGLNPQSLIEIDALARTMYAEMASCAPIGDEYLYAVARVIANRAEEVDKKRNNLRSKNPKASPERLLAQGREFINREEDHWPGKNTLSKVSSSPVQFTAWNSYMIDFEALNDARESEYGMLEARIKSPNKKRKLSKKEKNIEARSLENARRKAEEDNQPNAKTRKFYKFNESGLLQTLCPPSSKTANFHTGGKPSTDLQAIWKSILKVSVEATLYPTQFGARTSQVANVYNYTSDRKSFMNFVEIHPSINGHRIDNEKCLNLWVKPHK